ncbi:MAG: HAD family hydrolase [Candidatus Methanofastidiosa archaeon]|nr:HAD family hydrolase [Candidatus Methanofastidiosa archaeon]
MDTVIFDLDDTLADTWHATKRANRKLFFYFLKKRLFKLVRALIFRENVDFIANSSYILLMDSNDIIRMFIKNYYPDIPEEFLDGAVMEFDKEFFRNFKLNEGALDVLDYLKGRYRLCLVTDGTLRWQEQKIELLGINGYFDKIAIAGALGTSKPDPMNFMEVLSGSEDKVYVIGDRVETDIAGGASIGAVTILFKNGFFNYDRDCGIVPTYTIEHLSELRQYL